MKKVTIIRGPSTDAGTFGTLSVDDGWNCKTGELPWRDNENGKSCIPSGVYTCKWIMSPKHGPCYQVMNVPGRSMIEIHSANFVGDSECSGMDCQLLGCIALGSEVGFLRNSSGSKQRAVLNSMATVNEFNSHMGNMDFTLIIKDG